MMGCHRSGAEARAEAARLRRQIDVLETLSRDAERRDLFPEDRLAIGISEGLVRDVIRAQLPREALLIEPFRITVTDADVRFESGQSLIALTARLAAPRTTAGHADVTLTGGLAAIEVDAETGFLRSRIALDRLDLRRLPSEAMEPGLLRQFVESLGGRGMGAVGEVMAPLEIPMRLTRSVESRGIASGPVRIPPARLSVGFEVHRVLFLQNRLFVFLDARIGE
jgi:hypothetical protein